MALCKAAEEAVREIDDIIDREYAPEKMTPEEAVEFLEEIGSKAPRLTGRSKHSERKTTCE